MPLLGAIVLALAGCPDEPSKDTSSKDAPDAGANRALMDKNIEKAVKSVAGTPSGAPTSVDGPPPTGVFGPGLADKAHPAGAAAALQMVELGAEPRVVLRPGPAAKQSFSITVDKRYARNVFPTIAYALTAAPTEVAEDAGAPTAPQLTVTVDQATPSGQLEEKLIEEIGKLKGTTLTFPVAPNGALGVGTISLPGESTQGLSVLVSALAEVLSLALPPWPEQPVGQGAFWVSTDRAVVSGVPVVRYRVTRIETISAAEVTYKLEIREYAVDSGSLPLGAPPNVALAAFQAQGQASLTRAPGSLWPLGAQIKSPIVMQLANPQQPQAPIPVQLETQARLVTRAGKPDKKGDKKARPALPP